MEKRKWTQEEIREYRKTHRSILYFNKEDSNIFVPKAYGYGSTVNWANPISLIIIFAIVVFVILHVTKII